MIENLIFMYIWFGAVIPEDYLISVGKNNFISRVMVNPVYETTIKLDINKADRLRLEMLLDGGLYTDFDNTIDYKCLMKKIDAFDG